MTSQDLHISFLNSEMKGASLKEIEDTMIYSPVVQKPQQKISQNVSEQIARLRFLVVGYSSDAKGDRTVGIQIANHVSAWALPSLTSITAYQLTPDLVNNLVSVDYAFFVGPCRPSSNAQTLQIDPIFASSHSPRTERSAAQSPSENTYPCTPVTLLSLAQQLYGRSPQAWLLQIPTANTDCSQGLSSTAQRGYDHALRTIEQFFMTYQQPPRII